MPSSIRRLAATLALLIAAGPASLALSVPAAHAQASWLDQPVPASWNAVGMPIPAVPTGGSPDPTRGRGERRSAAPRPRPRSRT